ncbi:MAG: hypothetical protein IPL46_11125 [Saprospiraceae bacterium]|nr:hypothetical protein [Saprospiraceae bacterium]
MKIIIQFLLAVIILTLGSCVPSLHGIVTDETRITDDRILGVWSTNEMQKDGSPDHSEFPKRELDWSFERAENITYWVTDPNTKTTSDGLPESLLPSGARIVDRVALPYYILTHRELIEGDTVVSNLLVEMTEISSHLLMDFTPIPGDGNVFNGRFATNYVLAHTFSKVEFMDDKMQISPIDGDYVKDLITQKRIRLKNEIRNGGDIILTAPTQELRDFITNYSQDANLFDDADQLFRVN